MLDESKALHYYCESEVIAYSKWINNQLDDETDLGGLIPIQFEENADQLFKVLKDGLILAKLINMARPGTINESKLHKHPSLAVHVSENLNKVLEGAIKIGVRVFNVGADDIMRGTPHLCLGLIWQIIKINLLASFSPGNNLVSSSTTNSETNLAAKAHKEEPQTSSNSISNNAAALLSSKEKALLSWLNSTLSTTGCPKTVSNFGTDLSDSVALAYLLQSLGGVQFLDAAQLVKETHENLVARAGRVIDAAESLGCMQFASVEGIVNGNGRMNMGFVAVVHHKWAIRAKMMDGAEENTSRDGGDFIEDDIKQKTPLPNRSAVEAYNKDEAFEAGVEFADDIDDQSKPRSSKSSNKKQKQKQKMSAKIAQKEAELASAATDISKIQLELEAIKHENESLRSAITDSNKEIQISAARATIALDQERSRNDNLTARNIQLSEMYQQSQSDIEVAVRALETLEIRIQTSSGEVGEHMADILNSRQQVQAQKNETARIKIEQLNSQISQLSNMYKQSQSEVKISVQNLEAIEKRLKSCAEKFDECSAEKNDNIKRIQAQKDEVTRATIEHLNGEVLRLTGLYEQSQNEARAAAQALEALEKKSQSDQRISREKISEQVDLIHHLQDQAVNARAEAELLKDRISQMSDMYQKSQNEARAAIQALEDLEQKIQTDEQCYSSEKQNEAVIGFGSVETLNAVNIQKQRFNSDKQRSLDEIICAQQAEALQQIHVAMVDTAVLQKSAVTEQAFSSVRTENAKLFAQLKLDVDSTDDAGLLFALAGCVKNLNASNENSKKQIAELASSVDTLNMDLEKSQAEYRRSLERVAPRDSEKGMFRNANIEAEEEVDKKVIAITEVLREENARLRSIQRKNQRVISNSKASSTAKKAGDAAIQAMILLQDHNDKLRAALLEVSKFTAAAAQKCVATMEHLREEHDTLRERLIVQERISMTLLQQRSALIREVNRVNDYIFGSSTTARIMYSTEMLEGIISSDKEIPENGNLSEHQLKMENASMRAKLELADKITTTLFDQRSALIKYALYLSQVELQTSKDELQIYKKELQTSNKELQTSIRTSQTLKEQRSALIRESVTAIEKNNCLNQELDSEKLALHLSEKELQLARRTSQTLMEQRSALIRESVDTTDRTESLQQELGNESKERNKLKMIDSILRKQRSALIKSYMDSSAEADHVRLVESQRLKQIGGTLMDQRSLLISETLESREEIARLKKQLEKMIQ